MAYADPAEYADYQKRYRERNRDKAQLYMRERVSLGRAILDSEYARGCVDCGEKDFDVLEFDHVRGEKSGTVAQFMRSGPSRLYAEIDKCEVRCANCHRKVTATRRRAHQIDKEPS